MATKKKKAVAAKRKPKKAAVKKTVLKKTAKPAAKTSKKTVRAKAPKKARAPKKTPRKRAQQQTFGLNSGVWNSRSDVMSGDLQGLRDTEIADSESISELLEEGNALEAGILTGVEEAEENPEQEVRSRQVPEDDVPAEYLDED